LSGITLPAAQYTISNSKAVTLLSECIYVTREFRSFALRNDVSYKGIRDLLPEVDKLSSNYRGVSLICWQHVAIQTLLLSNG